ncbi:MAG: hypothetical protein PHT07_14920 [Paludibacter sp.]|nr:hypothetical protein [Paludibacter sp.]
MDKLPKFTQQVIEHVDGTPDADYPLRILKAYRENCNCKWSETGFPDLEKINPVLMLMNQHQEERAKILDKAIEILQNKNEAVKDKRLNDIALEIEHEATEYADSISSDSLNERGIKKAKEWARTDFIAGAQRYNSLLRVRGNHKEILMVYPGLHERFHGSVIETENHYVAYIDEFPKWADPTITK